MALWTLRLSDDLAARFDGLAAANGGRSAALRSLIARVCRDLPSEAPSAPRRVAMGRQRVEVRLSAAEMAELDRMARARGMGRADWIASLVRQRLEVTTPPPLDARNAIVDAWQQLKRIGVNLNQATHALNAAGMEGSRLDVRREAARVAEFRKEIAGEIAGLKRALAGDASYWSVP